MRGHQTESCNDSDWTGGAPPPYREVVGRPPSRSWRGDDMLVKKQIVAEPTEPRRRGVWRRIWDLLAGSKSARPQCSQSPAWPDQPRRVPGPPAAPPTPRPAAVSSRWRRATPLAREREAFCTHHQDHLHAAATAPRRVVSRRHRLAPGPPVAGRTAVPRAGGHVLPARDLCPVSKQTPPRPSPRNPLSPKYTTPPITNPQPSPSSPKLA
jgi:hypothetical protein